MLESRPSTHPPCQPRVSLFQAVTLHWAKLQLQQTWGQCKPPFQSLRQERTQWKPPTSKKSRAAASSMPGMQTFPPHQPLPQGPTDLGLGEGPEQEEAVRNTALLSEGLCAGPCAPAGRPSSSGFVRLRSPNKRALCGRELRQQGKESGRRDFSWASTWCSFFKRHPSPDKGLGAHRCSHFIGQGSVDILWKGPGSKYFWFCELRSLSHSYSTGPLSCESSSHMVWYCVDSTYMKKHGYLSIKLYL